MLARSARGLNRFPDDVVDVLVKPDLHLVVLADRPHQDGDAGGVVGPIAERELHASNVGRNTCRVILDAEVDGWCTGHGFTAFRAASAASREP